MDYVNQILRGDCQEVLNDLPDHCIDLIFTSPPYADQRQTTYGGVKPDEYVTWFMPKVEQFWRVLKPTGTFILNIKERVVVGRQFVGIELSEEYVSIARSRVAGTQLPLLVAETSDTPYSSTNSSKLPINGSS